MADRDSTQSKSETLLVSIHPSIDFNPVQPYTTERQSWGFIDSIPGGIMQ